MKKITDVSELRLIQMDILSYVDKVCRENGIKYSLAGGTLIGAVRHKGYIPWDDDIDIMLVREEYEKLVDILSANDSDNNIPYKILTHSKEKQLNKQMAINKEIKALRKLLEEKEKWNE